MSAFPFTAAGLDVGYGNVKLSARAAGEPILRELTMPIGAVPLERVMNFEIERLHFQASGS
ncbi:hypothetical protein P1940_14335 [Xanthomonas perforans]